MVWGRLGSKQWVKTAKYYGVGETAFKREGQNSIWCREDWAQNRGSKSIWCRGDWAQNRGSKSIWCRGDWAQNRVKKHMV